MKTLFKIILICLAPSALAHQGVAFGGNGSISQVSASVKACMDLNDLYKGSDPVDSNESSRLAQSCIKARSACNTSAQFIAGLNKPLPTEIASCGIGSQVAQRAYVNLPCLDTDNRVIYTITTTPDSDLARLSAICQGDGGVLASPLKTK